MSVPLAAIAEHFGTPCFAYDLDAIRLRASEIRAAFGSRFDLSYAVKSNPNRTLLRHLQPVIETLDVSSGGEVRRAREASWPAAKISFTGPGKTASELTAAVRERIGYVIVESVEEARRLSAIALQHGAAQPILLRLSPAHMPSGFGVSMAGRPSPFGVDEEDCEAAIALLLTLPGVTLRGFHIYSGTQCLKAAAVAQNYANFIRLFRHLAGRFDLQSEKLIFGSGLGIPYYLDDSALDLPAVAAQTNPALDALLAESRFQKTTCVLELGRYLVGEAGYYLTRVVGLKTSRGAHLAICDGGMNHHLAACGHLGTVIPRNFRLSRVPALGVSTPPEPVGELRSYELVGPLCTSIDRLARNVRLPELQVGDVIAVECSGAYGLTASPFHFISHAPPREVLCLRNESAQLVAEEITEAHDTSLAPCPPKLFHV